MNISSFAEAFVPLLKKNKLEAKREDEEKYNILMVSLFKDLLEGEKYFQRCPISIEQVDSKIQEKIHLTNNSRFFPKAIRKYIQDTPSKVFTYNCKIKDRENRINFYTFANVIEFQNYVKIMYIWLYICDKYAQKKCAKEMNINIYLTPFKKTLPLSKTTIISAEHVNTAFTYCCAPEGEITIFRAEEWFKVFLHESFHAYNLDFGLSPDSTALRKVIESHFHVKSDFNANEAYTETWARIINCALYSFCSLSDKKDKKKETFLMYTDFCLQLERLFSLYQMNKILRFMGLNYSDIYSPGAYLKHHLYKEDTHVFGYYVLPALFLNDYKQFIQWCAVINTNSSSGFSSTSVSVSSTSASSTSAGSFMKFNCQKESFEKMGNYISKIYTDDTLLKTIDVIKIKINNPIYETTTRMAIVDLTDI